jgi:hypothetical protein
MAAALAWATVGAPVVWRAGATVREAAFPVLMLAAFFGAQAVGAVGSALLSTPFLTYQPPYWRTLLLYGGGGLYVGYLCWRRAPRARFAAYVFLSVDVIRAVRGGHWWAAAIDLAIVLSLQTPAFRRIYPAVRPAHFLRRRRARPSPPDHAPPHPSQAD